MYATYLYVDVCAYMKMYDGAAAAYQIGSRAIRRDAIQQSGICIYTYIYTYIHIYIHTHARTFAGEWKGIWTYYSVSNRLARVKKGRHTAIWNMYTYMHTYIIYTYIHTYTHTHIYIYTYTHARAHLQENGKVFGHTTAYQTGSRATNGVGHTIHTTTPNKLWQTGQSRYAPTMLYRI